MDTITIKEMLRVMESGETFSIDKAVSYDRKRKTGGDIIEYPEARLVQAEQEPTSDRPLTRVEQLKKQKARVPRHRKWYTRNIRLCIGGHPTGQIRKVHPPLILEFNGKTVV
jgi:hypothetical protein